MKAFKQKMNRKDRYRVGEREIKTDRQAFWVRKLNVLKTVVFGKQSQDFGLPNYFIYLAFVILGSK